MEKAYSAKNGMAAGGIGGIVAGAIMFIPIMGMMSAMNLPPDLFSTVVGMTMGKPPESAAMTGMTLHFVPSTVIGLIFGAIISSSRLTITGFKKGVLLGVVAGIVSFIALFLPMMMIIPPVMVQLMQMMNPDAPQEVIMDQIQLMQPMLLSGSLFAHIVYGVVLGVVTTAILRGRLKKIQMR